MNALKVLGVGLGLFLGGAGIIPVLGVGALYVLGGGGSDSFNVGTAILVVGYLMYPLLIALVVVLTVAAVTLFATVLIQRIRVAVR